MSIEVDNTVPPVDDQLEIIARLLLAAALGAVIGLERELRGNPAGIRTMALVTLGACLFTDVSRLMGGDDRVAAQVVTGIGFIGAGVVFRDGAGVRGITTAATIWGRGGGGNGRRHRTVRSCGGRSGDHLCAALGATAHAPAGRGADNPGDAN